MEAEQYEDDHFELDEVSKASRIAFRILKHTSGPPLGACGVSRYFRIGDEQYRINLRRMGPIEQANCETVSIDYPIDSLEPPFFEWRGDGHYGVQARKLRRFYRLNLVEVADCMGLRVAEISSLENESLPFNEILVRDFNNAVRKVVENKGL